ncbi:MAG TPA: nuclear transport factor 2 family protein [Chitinophagaceae bacterium]|nr:nuclear transport factor 2 family protein [Chitinophagaceae bacterium]
MKNKSSITVLLVAGILSVLFSCNTKKEESVAAAIDKEQIKKEIQAKEDAFAKVYNEGSLTDIGYYADDAVSFFPNRPPLIGKEAIRAYYISSIASNTNKISFTSKDILISNDGNLVVETGYYKVVDSTNTVFNSGSFISIFEKRDGKYVCVKDMSTSDIPVE